MSERELYEQRFRAKLDEWRADLAKMKAKAEGASAEARLEWQREVDALEQEIGHAEARLSEMRDARDDAWSSLKEGAEEAWTSLSDGFRRASERLQR